MGSAKNGAQAELGLRTHVPTTLVAPWCMGRLSSSGRCSSGQWRSGLRLPSQSMAARLVRKPPPPTSERCRAP